MKKRDLDDYELFYMELPQADYLKDIEIQDELEEEEDSVQGLSDEQVSQIARDSLNAARQDQPNEDNGGSNLFSDGNDQ